MKKLVGGFVYFSWDLLKRFFADDCLYRASALTFTTLLALVPLMTVGLSLFVAIPTFHTWGQQVQRFIFQHFVPTSGQAVESYLQSFVEQAQNLSLVGSIFLLLTALLMLLTIEQTFNHIWRVKKTRHGFKAVVLYSVILTVAPVLLGASLALSNYVMSIPMVMRFLSLLGLNHVLLSLFSFGSATIGFMLLYSAIPNCRVPIRHALVGAAVAAILFGITKYGFGLYLTYFPSYTLLYGPFAVVPVFLTWIYLMWVIVLFGAELTHELGLRLGS